MEKASVALENLLGAYNERVQSQLDSVVREFNSLSRSILNTVKMHHETVFHDFMRRQKTGAIPADPANFYACLAGSFIMCGSAQLAKVSARQIEAEFVSLSWNGMFERNCVRL